MDIKFPAPREVDKFLYRIRSLAWLWRISYYSRPLARWIGYFTLGLEKNIDVSIYAFPSPLEVDRYLYANVLLTIKNQAKTSFRPLSR